MQFSNILNSIVWLVFWYVILFLWVFVWGWSRNSCFLLMTFETIILSFVWFLYLFYQVWFEKPLANTNSRLIHFLLRIFYSLLICTICYHGWLFILTMRVFFSSKGIIFESSKDCLLWCINLTSSFSLKFIENLSFKIIWSKIISFDIIPYEIKTVTIPLSLYLITILTNVVYPLFRERKITSFTYSLFKKIIGNWFQLLIIFVIWMIFATIIWNIWFLIVKSWIDIFLLWYHYLYLKK